MEAVHKERARFCSPNQFIHLIHLNFFYIEILMLIFTGIETYILSQQLLAVRHLHLLCTWYKLKISWLHTQNQWNDAHRGLATKVVMNGMFWHTANQPCMAFSHCNPWLRDKQGPKKHAEICIFLLESNGRMIGNVSKRQMARLCELEFRAQIYMSRYINYNGLLNRWDSSCKSISWSSWELRCY